MNKFMFSDVKFVAFGKLFIYKVDLLRKNITFEIDCFNEINIDLMYHFAIDHFVTDDGVELLDIIDELTGKSFSISYNTYKGLVGGKLFIVIKLEEDTDLDE